MGRANLEVFSATLLTLGRDDPDLLVVTSDSRGSAKLTAFAQELPDQIVEVGIAEQNLVGIAAGLTAAGKHVFAVSPACFLTARALEQIKNDVAYSDQPVKLVGISAGVSYGALGTTHHSLHDYAALRAINNITVVAPADNLETDAAIRAAVAYDHPIYLRFGKKAMPDLHAPDTPFEIGRAITLARGADVTFIATGETVAPCVEARDKLSAQGIACGVISMHTVKPLDVDAVIEAGRASRAVITVEEHSVYGGLGEACAAVLMQQRVSVPFRIVAIPDEYTVSGSQVEIFAHYGISGDGLAATAQQLLAGSVGL
jgi:transketolase